MKAILFLVCVTVAGCSKSSEYDTPVKSATAVQSELTQACLSAAQKKQPLLIEFSAPWCGDCQKLHGMKAEAELAAELANWDLVVINVGQFDQHTDLQGAFEVGAIANWAVVTPTDCATPAQTWPRKAQRTLEPRSGEPVTSSELATWLRSNRG